MNRDPLMGEVWLVSLDPTLGQEQAGTWPALIVSEDTVNRGPAELVLVCPITSRDKRVPFHVPVHPPEGGVAMESFVKCEDLRSISKERLSRCWGTVTAETMASVRDRLRMLMDL